MRLIADIEKFLGYDRVSEAILIGAGGLGKAFLRYEGFKSNGLNIVAAFESNPELVGKQIAGKPVLAMEQLKEFVADHNVRIGIITVPKSAAQDVLDRLVEAGIKGVWNFAPVSLRAPKEVVLKTEDLAASLAILAGKLYERRQ